MTTALPHPRSPSNADPDKALPGWSSTPPPQQQLSLADPLVAADFSGWMRQVLGVLRRSFVRLALIWAVPAALIALFSTGFNQVLAGRAEALQPVLSTNPDQGPWSVAAAVLSTLYAGLLPFMLLFVAVWLVVLAFGMSASFFVAVSDAQARVSAGQPRVTSTAAGLRYACTRALPLIGWLVVVELLVVAGYAALAVPGVYLSVALVGPVFGVVILERGGIGRCFQLTKGRFWATLGRLSAAAVVVSVGATVLAIPVGILAALLASADMGVIAYALGGIAYAVLMIPALVFFAAVYLVTYAELRYRENPATSTVVLAAEMVRP